MKKNTADKRAELPLGRKNYILLLCGIAAIVLGFILLSGGGSENPATEFNHEMFSFRRLYIAPLLLLGGFAFEIYAIMYRPKQMPKTAEQDSKNTEE